MYRTTGAAGYYPGGTLGYGASLNYGLNGAGGTLCNKLVKLDGVGKLTVTAGGETLGVIGVAVSGCGTTGVVQYAVVGQVPIIFDTASPVVGHYVGISAGSGQVTDQGATPGTGQNIGRVILGPSGAVPTNCNVAAICYVQVTLGSASGGGVAACAGSCISTAPVGNQTITQPPGTTFEIDGGNFIVQAGGPVNGIFGPDSGTNAAVNGTNNTWQLASGSAPGSQAIPASGSFLPIWAAKVSGVVYASVLEMQANKDQPNGYAGLDNNGQVPIAELIAAAGLGGCTGANFVKGDFSGCQAGSASVPFTNILGGTNNSAAMILNTGASLTAIGTGSIDATTVKTVVYPLNSGAAGGAGADNRVYQTISAGNVSAIQLPDCIGANFLQHNNTAHTWPCSAPAGTTAPIQVSCNGVSGLCPDATPLTGTAAVIILQSFSIPANSISTGRCADATAWIQHPTGSASVVYSWNVGGTGSRGAAPTGGTNLPNQASASTNGFQQLRVWLCNTGATARNYVRQEQMQVGSTQISGVAQPTSSIDWTITQQVSVTINAPITDQIAFNGAYVTF